jgi:leukotriene-A4 hydrolase
LLSVQNGYEPAAARVETFLTEQGRRKFLKPLYEELVKTPAGRERALAIYRKARSTYHPVSIETVDAIVGWTEGK